MGGLYSIPGKKITHFLLTDTFDERNSDETSMCPSSNILINNHYSRKVSPVTSSPMSFLTNLNQCPYLCPFSQSTYTKKYMDFSNIEHFRPSPTDVAARAPLSTRIPPVHACSKPSSCALRPSLKRSASTISCRESTPLIKKNCTSPKQTSIGSPAGFRTQSTRKRSASSTRCEEESRTPIKKCRMLCKCPLCLLSMEELQEQNVMFSHLLPTKGFFSPTLSRCAGTMITSMASIECPVCWTPVR